MKVSTDIVESQLKIFELGMDQGEYITGVMIRTVRHSNTDMPQLELALEKVGLLAHAAGVSFIDLNAIIGTMANRGIKGIHAGAKLVQVFEDLIRMQLALKDASGTTINDHD